MLVTCARLDAAVSWSEQGRPSSKQRDLAENPGLPVYWESRTLLPRSLGLAWLYVQEVSPDPDPARGFFPGLFLFLSS